MYVHVTHVICAGIFLAVNQLVLCLGALFFHGLYTKGRSGHEEFGDSPYLSDFERDVDGSEDSYAADDSMNGTGHQTDSEPETPESEQEGEDESPPELGDKQSKRRCMERSSDRDVPKTRGVAGKSNTM